MLLLVHYSTVSIVAKGYLRARVSQGLRDCQGCHMGVQTQVRMGALLGLLAEPLRERLQLRIRNRPRP